MNPDDRIVLRAFANIDRFVRQVWQLQHEGVARGLNFAGLLVERGNAVAQLARLRLFRLRLRGFLLSHQRADFLGNAIALRFQRFNFRQNFPPRFVELEHFINQGFIPCPARRQTPTHKIRFLANQFDVEHRAIIEIKSSAARRKPWAEKSD